MKREKGKEHAQVNQRYGNRNCRLIFAAILFLLAGAGLFAATRTICGFADWYSIHIYPVLVEVVGKVMGKVPFSVSEVLLYLFAVRGIFWLGKTIVLCCRKEKVKERIERGTAGFFLFASVLFFLYMLNCGVNYYRTTFSESAGIVTEEYSIKELKEVCRWLTKQVNERADLVERDADGLMTLANVEVEKESVEAVEGLGESYKVLQGDYPIPKGLLNRWILSVQSLTGVYSPFTVEANYNSGMVDYNIPFTACHELSHLRGFMEEKEANYIGFLACINSETEEFQYSGYLMGWIYCMNVLYQEDYKAWEELRAELSRAVEADLRENSAFWAKYDTAIAEVSNQINDNYLKANGQEEGVESYDRMVDLIVSQYLAGKFEE